MEHFKDAYDLHNKQTRESLLTEMLCTVRDYLKHTIRVVVNISDCIFTEAAFNNQKNKYSYHITITGTVFSCVVIHNLLMADMMMLADEVTKNLVDLLYTKSV